MAFIKLYVFDSDYSGEHQQEYYAIDHPSLEDFEKEIKSINGKNRTAVKLVAENYSSMAIGSGYCCNVVLMNEPPSQFRLLNPDISKELPEPGQQQDPECVPLELVLEAAIHYYKTSELKESLIWDQKG